MSCTTSSLDACRERKGHYSSYKGQHKSTIATSENASTEMKIMQPILLSASVE